MAGIRWSERAADDLEDTHRFIARDSLATAATTVGRIANAIDRLELFPLSGRTIPEDPGGPYRELIVGSYRVVYRADNEFASIVAIVAARRRLEPELLE